MNQTQLYVDIKNESCSFTIVIREQTHTHTHTEWNNERNNNKQTKELNWILNEEKRKLKQCDD